MSKSTFANKTAGKLVAHAADPAGSQRLFKSMASRLYGKTHGPANLAPTVIQGKVSPVERKAPVGRDSWRPGAPQSISGTSAPAKSAVTARTAKEAPGNQGPEHAPHTKPGTAKETALAAKMRSTATPTSAAPLQKVGGDKLGDKKGASNAPRRSAAETMYPRMKQAMSAKR